MVKKVKTKAKAKVKPVVKTYKQKLKELTSKLLPEKKALQVLQVEYAKVLGKLQDQRNVVNKLDVEIYDLKQAEKNKKDIMPLSGPFKAYKKAYLNKYQTSKVVVTLEIAAKTRRNQNLNDHQGWKCRAEKAKVLSIKTINGKNVKVAYSGYNGGQTKYVVGKTVKCNRWSTSKETCAGGIHFFMQRHRAASY